MRNHVKKSCFGQHICGLCRRGFFCGAGSRESRVWIILTSGEHKPHAVSVRKSHILQGECADSSIFLCNWQVELRSALAERRHLPVLEPESNPFRTTGRTSAVWLRSPTRNSVTLAH